MKKKSKPQSAVFNPRVLILVFLTTGVLVALLTASAAERIRRGEANAPKFGLGPGDGVIPSGGNWLTTGSLNIARGEHTAALLASGKVIVAGGVGDNASQSAELYDPVGGNWSATGSLNIARALHTATVLPNGMVLVTGGLDINFNVTPSAELYDPGKRELDGHRQSQHRALCAHGDIATQRHGACCRWGR